MNKPGLGAVALLSALAACSDAQLLSPLTQHTTVVALCFGKPATISPGNPGAAVSFQGDSSGYDISGSPGDDVIIGSSGDDNLDGGGGVDRICAGDGDDQTYTDATSLVRIDGGPGTDVLTFWADTGVNVNMVTGTGPNTRFINIENIDGTEFHDVLRGDAGNNFLRGAEGDDRIYGGGGADIMDGYDGDDTFYPGSGGRPLIYGGSGTNTVSFRYLTEGAFADLAMSEGGPLSFPDGEIHDIQNITGTTFDDELLGDNDNNILVGGDGDDDLNGRNGMDLLLGGKGTNTLVGGNDYDTSRGVGCNDTLDGIESIRYIKCPHVTLSTMTAAPAQIAATVGAYSTITAVLYDQNTGKRIRNVGVLDVTMTTSKALLWDGASLVGTTLAATANADGSYSLRQMSTGTNTTAIVTVTADGVPLNATATVVFGTGGPAAAVAIPGLDLNATVGTGVPQPPAVRVTDVNGNAVAGHLVTFAVTAGGGLVNGALFANVYTDANGVAALSSWIFGTTAGLQLVDAAPASLGSILFEGDALPDLPDTLIIVSGNPQTGPAGVAVAAPPTVQVQDQYGNGAFGINITFAVITGGGSITGASQTTDGFGNAQVGSWTLGAVGNNQLSATMTVGTTRTVVFSAIAN